MIYIKNGTLITKNNQRPLIKDGSLLIRDDRIIKAGSVDEVESFLKSLGKESLGKDNPFAEIQEIDARGMIVMPGFINCHEHIYSQFARGAGIPKTAPVDFLSVLEGTWWHLDKNLSLENVYYSAIATFIESIKNGVTAVNDHHASFGAVKGSLDEIAKAAGLCGMRTCLCYEISNREGKLKLQESIEENIEFCNKVNLKKGNMIKGLIGLHASFTVDDNAFSIIKGLNTEGFGYHVHIAEGLYDKEHCERTYGCSIVERFEKEGILGPKTVAGHCIHVSEKDMDILRETGTKVIHNPESNMGNGVGSPDVLKMLDKGIMVGLGTDGYTHDMTESLKVANMLQKNRNLNPARGFCEAIELLENNGQIASFIFDDKIGRLEEGYAADVIIVDYKPCTPLTEDNISGHLMFGISGSMTDTTIINGKVVMKNRVLVGINEEDLLEKSRISAGNLWRCL